MLVSNDNIDPVYGGKNVLTIIVIIVEIFILLLILSFSTVVSHSALYPLSNVISPAIRDIIVAIFVFSALLFFFAKFFKLSFNEFRLLYVNTWGGISIPICSKPILQTTPTT